MCLEKGDSNIKCISGIVNKLTNCACKVNNQFFSLRQFSTQWYTIDVIQKPNLLFIQILSILTYQLKFSVSSRDGQPSHIENYYLACNIRLIYTTSII